MKLTERKQRDRIRMAELLVEAVNNAGGAAHAVESITSRDIRIKVTAPGGAYVEVEFDGDSPQPDVFVATWNIDREHRETRFCPSFGQVNSFHGRKASRVAHGFEALRRQIAQDVEACDLGIAYINA